MAKITKPRVSGKGVPSLVTPRVERAIRRVLRVGREGSATRPGAVLDTSIEFYEREITKHPPWQTTAMLIATIGKLTAKQQHVLGCVYIGLDSGHPRATLDSLVRHGLIDRYTGEIAGRRGGSAIERLPLLVARYRCPSIGHHMAWCAWCSQQPDDADGAS